MAANKKIGKKAEENICDDDGGGVVQIKMLRSYCGRLGNFKHGEIYIITKDLYEMIKSECEEIK